MRLLDEAFGIESGQMTTVHCYTGSQPTVDKPRGAPERSRAAALSMVPTTTSAQHQTGLVLPHWRAGSRRAPSACPPPACRAIDLTVQTRAPVTAAAANEVLEEAAAGSPVFGWTEQPLVSADLRGRPESDRDRGPGNLGLEWRAAAGVRLVRQRMGLFLPDAGHGPPDRAAIDAAPGASLLPAGPDS